MKYSMKKPFYLSCIIIFSFFVNNSVFAIYKVTSPGAEGGSITFTITEWDQGTPAVYGPYDDYNGRYPITVPAIPPKIISQKNVDVATLKHLVNVANGLEKEIALFKTAVYDDFKKLSDTQKDFSQGTENKNIALEKEISNLKNNIMESIKNIPAELKPSENIERIIRGMIKSELSTMVKSELSTMKEEIKVEILKELK